MIVVKYFGVAVYAGIWWCFVKAPRGISSRLGCSVDDAFPTARPMTHHARFTSLVLSFCSVLLHLTSLSLTHSSLTCFFELSPLPAQVPEGPGLGAGLAQR